ncbi:hypothetical protein [Vulcanisaeta distributa]|uniref:Uncharacterized protein n=1 Tax=Vulcanisaeta distributa (strain DSM 14429 / JCM 11212 / NBRC 100878 / IC-017) TaxID=572478 RepID=E1QU59_VULDI|nr:hypothetical protein [Vulcanisaeta distributa]ADN51053.1 hypothetical protein Vdis_1676 [Vulcanisaeta distributa DSM 14429]
MALEIAKPLRVCWGVKVKGSKRIVCGETVNDPRIIEETMKLIGEFLTRVEKHKSVLLSGLATPFDDVINDLSNWLWSIREKIKGGNDENIAKLRMAMLKVSEKMLMLVRQAKENWLSIFKPELEELIEELRKGKVEVIITGEPFNEDKSFMVHLYTGHLAIGVSRVRRSVTVVITLTGLRGVRIIMPKLFNDVKLRAMRYGLLLTDGAINKAGNPEMNTNQIWQTVIWLMAWPGRNHVLVHGVNLNEDNVAIVWILTAMDHRVKSKAKVAKEVHKFDDEVFLTFLLTAVLGDGAVDVKGKRVRLMIGNSKYGLWRDIIRRMKNLGFRDYDSEYKKEIYIYYSKAVGLAKRWLSDVLIRALIEDLSSLSDAEKLKRLLVLVDMKIKSRGKSSIKVIADVRMSVSVSYNGYVTLKAWRSKFENAKTIQEALRRAGFNAELSQRGNGFMVYIIKDEIIKHPELLTRVCEVLKEMLDEAVSEGKTRRAKAIIKAMIKLNCQNAAQSPRA